MPTSASLSCSGRRPSVTPCTRVRSLKPANEWLSPPKLTMANASCHDFSMGLDSSMTRSTSAKSTSGDARVIDRSLSHMPNASCAAFSPRSVPPMPNTSTMNAHRTHAHPASPT